MKIEDLKVLIEGKHEDRGDKKGINSTVTLIKTDKNVLVDTGSFLDREMLISQLSNNGLKPEDIGFVVLTHLHLDHVVNVDLFRNAKIVCKFFGGEYPGQYHIPKEGCVVRFSIEDGTEIAEHVKLLLTPGHTMDSISVLVDTDEGKIVICGDAIANEEWASPEKQPVKMLVADVEAYNKSRVKILEMADYIVPGHGSMFKV